MKLNKITSMLFGGALLFGAAACTDEVEYTPTEPIAVEGVYFSETESNVVDIHDNANKVAINLYRVNADKAITVDLSGEVLGANGTPVPQIFDVPTQVSFPAGETVVPIEIGVVFGDVTPEEEYTLNLKILGDQVNPYGLAEREFIITYAPWSEWKLYNDGKDGYGTMTFALLLNGVGELPIYERKSEVNENKMQYLVPDPMTLDLNDPDFDPTSDVAYAYIISMDKTDLIKVDGTTCYRVSTNIINTQEKVNGEVLMLASANTFYIDVLGGNPANADAFIEGNSFGQSYYNPEKGLFTLGMVMYTNEAVAAGGYKGKANEYLQLPGYKDYWMEFEYLGNFVDGSGTEKAIVQATRSTDLASYAYVCKKGTLTQAEIDQIADGIKADTESELFFDESANLQFELKEDSKYTIVAVCYNEGGEAVYTTAYTFDYKTVMKESTWESIGWCQYTEGFFTNIWYTPAISGQTWDVEIEEHKEQPGYYRLVNPYVEWPTNLQANGLLAVSGMYYLYVNASDPDGVYVEQSMSGINLAPVLGENVGMSILSSLAYYHMQNGKTLEQVKSEGYCGKLSNGVITFPAGVLLYSEEAYPNPGNANLDPNNPAFEDMKNPNWDGKNFNPFWGTGRFKIDLRTLDAAAPRQARSIANAAKVAVTQTAANAKRICIEGKQTNGYRATKMSETDRDSFNNTVKTIIR